MQMMNEDKISKDIDKVVAKLHTLEKKKKLWGLSEAENKELNVLMFQYMKNYYQLIDVVFTNYIEPFLYNDKIIDIKESLLQKYGWDGGLLFFDKDITELFNNLKNRKEVIEQLQELKKEELKMAAYFEVSEYGAEVIELFGTLQNHNDENCIEKYIQTRYNIMTTLIEEDGNEQTNKESR